LKSQSNPVIRDLTPSNKEPESKTLRIVKGGGWASDKKSAQISFRNVVYPAMKKPAIGFRCAKSN
jgi:formylglycine-generating enzyme required for sulfatase activity